MSTRLHEWRKARGWSFDELSGITGVSASMLSRVESGKRQLAPDTRVLVARRLGAKVSDLFEVELIKDAK